MRRFGVIVCPSCQWARAVDLGKRTVTCLRCGKRYDVNELRIHARSDHATDLSEAIGRLNERYKGKGHRAPRGALGTVGRSDEAGKIRRPSEKDIMAIVERLCSRKQGMTKDNLVEALTKAGLDTDGVDVRIEALLEAGVIYEPEDGIYKQA